MSWKKLGLDWIGDRTGIHPGNNPRPDPTHFANGQSVPTGSGGLGGSGGSPLPNGGTGAGPSGGSGGSAFTSAQQAQLQSALDAAGIWGTIQNLGGDVWGIISKILPKGADGGVDWGKLGGDIVGWVGAHKKDIVDAVSAYSSYQRQNKADQLGKEAVDMAKQSYAEKAPLRVAGQSGMLNPQANAPDLSSLKAGIPQPTIAPLPVAGQNQNMRNAQGIAGPGSGNPFAKPLPVAPITPTGPTGGASGPPIPGMPGGGASPAAPSPMRPIAPSAPRPLPVAGTPQNPQQPAHYLINGLDQDASGKPVQGGYNELSDLYKQLGTSPGSVGDPRILAAVKANPKLIDALPVADAETLRRTMQSVGA